MFHITASYRLSSALFHDNWASHSRDTIWSSKFKVKGQGQRYPSQHSIQMTHFLTAWHQGIPSTPVPYVPWQLGLPFQRYNLTQNSRSKVKVKGTPVSAVPIWLISLAFHIRASYRLRSPSFLDNPASHSRDTIWPSKFKVKGTPVSAASSWVISLVFHTRASYRFPLLSIHDNRASHFRDTIWPWKFKVKGQGQRYPSQRSIQLTHFLFVSHQSDQPFLRYGK